MDWDVLTIGGMIAMVGSLIASMIEVGVLQSHLVLHTLTQQEAIFGANFVSASMLVAMAAFISIAIGKTMTFVKGL